MYILNDNTQLYPFCRLKLVVETFEHSTNESIKIATLVKFVEKEKRYMKTFWTSVIDRPLSPLSLMCVIDREGVRGREKER